MKHARIHLQSAVLALALVPLLGLGCNDTPVAGLEKSFTLKVETGSGENAPIPIDFLWVVDNSSSMCEEQVALASSFQTFTDRLTEAFAIDPRVAVTTHDAQCDVNGDTIVSSKGLFNSVPATSFPPPCQERRIVRCQTDADCAGTIPGDDGDWACRAPNTESCLVNPNGTINSTCRRRCTTDVECQDLFGDTRYFCNKPSSNDADSGCMLPPLTESCPATVPPVLDASNIDLFPCAATVGVNQEKCLNYEQGMRSALMALDPGGINAEQAQNFLRDDAYLVIIFVSDEDDCSVADGRSISEDNYETCALLATTDQDGPLVPVGHYVNRFKGLKSDPGRVIVAAIAGDSTEDDPGSVDAQRDAYLVSKGDPKACFHQSYICLSESGKADYGARYLELADSFGANGIFTNICKEEEGQQGVEIALNAIADQIIRVLNKICLPRQILDEDQLVVTRRTSAGDEQLPRGEGPGTYSIIDVNEDCVVDGQLMPAIGFGDPPTPGEEIIITYEGDPQFDQ